MAYVTLAEVRQHGEYSPKEIHKDAEISALIPRAEQAIETYTNQVFEVESTSARTFDPIEDTDGYILYFDEWLSDTSSLVVTNGDATVIASSKFVTIPRNRSPHYGIQLKTDSDVIWEYTDTPEDAISIVGYWGYSQTPPDDVKLACIQLILHWLRMEDQSLTNDMPESVCMLLKPYKQKVGWL